MQESNFKRMSAMFILEKKEMCITIYKELLENISVQPP